MSLPHFNLPTSNIIKSSIFDIKFYDKKGVEINEIYVGSINITETDDSHLGIVGGIVRKLDLTINSSDKFITNFENVSRINYCYFRIISNSRKSISEKIYRIELNSIQYLLNYSVLDVLSEVDCEFYIRKEYNIINNNNVAESIKVILRGRKIDDILA